MAESPEACPRSGAYARIRHPQYVGFVLIMVGFLFQWPTWVTLTMFPVLVFMYVRLAKREEREALVEFGEAYRAYMRGVPAFFPKLARTNASGRQPPPHTQAGGE